MQAYNCANVWNITGFNSGTLTTGSGIKTFTNVGTLIGGASSDIFIFSLGGSLSGSIDGGGSALLNSLEASPGNNDWTITGNNTGTVTKLASGFKNIATLRGGLGADTFTLEAGGSLDGSIEGGGGANLNTIRGSNQSLNLTIAGANSGSVTGVTLGFTNIGNLVGSSSNDNFTLNLAGSLAGSIDGSGGNNTLQGANINTTWTINSANAGTITAIAGGFRNIQDLVGGTADDQFILGVNGSANITGGGGNNTLQGGSVANTWTITSTDTGNVDNIAGTTEFSDIANLIGGDSDDTFILENDSQIAGEIAGGGGNNTLQGGDVNNTWTIIDNNIGDITNSGGTTSFTEIANLIGGDQADTFTLENDSQITGAIVGEGGNNTLQGGDVNNTWTITAENAGNITNIGGTTNFTEIINLIGGDEDDTFILENDSQIVGEIAGKEGDNTLKGGNVKNTWTITDENTGDIENNAGNTNFTEIANLIGGNNNDTFILEADNRITGEIAGGGGNDTLEGGNVNNTWTITDNNAGVVENSAGRTEFSQIAYLTGNNQADIFILEDNSHITGAIAGGEGANTLQGGNVENNWTITAENAGNITNSEGTTNFTEIANLIGGNDDDTFILQADNQITGEIAGRAGDNTLEGGNVNNTWTITNENAGEIDNLGGRTDFREITNLIGGNDNDTFILENNKHITGEIAGRAGDNTLEGGNVNNTWTITDENAGNIANSSGRTAFTEIAYLTGSDQDDIFILEEDSYITGAIAGGLGENTLEGGNVENNWTINAENAGTVDNGNGTTEFREITNLIGGNKEDTFVFEDNGLLSSDVTVDGGQGDPKLNTLEINADTALNWAISRQNGGDVEGEDLFLEFSNIANLKGSAGDDEFKLEDATVDGTIDGRAGVNILSGGITDTTNTWVVDGINSGTFTAIKDDTTYTFDFSNIQNLNGSDADDVFKLRGGVLYGSGSINGGKGDDTIEQEGSADDDDDDFTTTWNLTDEDSGTISDSTPETFTVNGETVTTDLVLREGFTNIENLVGGDAADVFIVNDDVTFTGNIDAGDGGDTVILTGTGIIIGSVSGGDNADEVVDVIDFSETTNPVTIDLQDINFSEFEVVIGNEEDNTLIGADQPNTWEIIGEDEVVIDNITFIGFNNLVGGAGVDTFNFTAADAVVQIDEEVPPDATGDVFSLTLITGNLLARLLARNPEDAVAISDVEGTAITGDESSLIAGSYGRLNISADGTYGYAVELSDPAVANLPVGASLTETFSYTIEQGTTSITTELIVTIQNTANGLIMTDNVNSIDITGAVSGGDGDDIFNFANDALIAAIIDSDAGGDIFNFDDTAQVAGTVDGGDNLADIPDVVDFSQAIGTVVINLANNGFNNIETFVGNGSETTLIALDTVNTWTLEDTNTGNLSQSGSSSIEFSNIGNLTGGTNNDTFNIKGTTRLVDGQKQTDWGVTGTIDGGEGKNAIVIGVIDTPGITWEIEGGNAGKAWDEINLTGTSPAIFSSDKINFNKPHNLFDGQTVLYANDSNNDIPGLKRGELYNVRRIDEQTISLVDNQGRTVTGLSSPANLEKHWLTQQIHLNFQNIGDIKAGDQNDTFFLRPDGSLSGTIDGGAGNNSLQGSDTANIWDINNNNSGQIFSSTELIFDGSSPSVVNTTNNTISFAYAHNLITGDRVQYLNGIDRTNGNIGELVNGNFYRVIRVDNFTIQLTDLNNLNILMLSAATLGGNNRLIKATTFNSDFSNIGSLFGGGGNDSFNININSRIANIFGRSGINTLRRNAKSTWNLTGTDSGYIDLVGEFSQISNLIGANADDTFIVNNNARLTGSIDGGSGNNTLQSNSANFVNWVISDQNYGILHGKNASVPPILWSNIDNLIGSNNEDTFKIVNQGVVSSIDGKGGSNTVQASNVLNEWTVNNTNSGSLTRFGLSDNPITSNTGRSVENNTLSTLAFNPSLRTGQAVTYSHSVLINSFTGLSKDQTYFAIVKDATHIQLAATEADALAGQAINISDAPPGTQTLTDFNTFPPRIIDFTELFVTEPVFTGARLLYRNNGGADAFGLIDGQTYYGISRLGGSDLTFKLAATFQDALNRIAVINISDLSSIRKHYFSPVDGFSATINFTNVGNIQGGTQKDTFTLARGTLSGAVDGKGGNDVLAVNSNPATTWTLTGVDTGTVTGITGGFSNIANLKGGLVVDTFIIGANGRLSSVNGIDGGGGLNTLQIANNNGAAYTWEITGTDTGNLQGAITGFTNIGKLIGGLGADTFIFQPGGSLTPGGSVDGGGAPKLNTLQLNSALALSWLINSQDAGLVQGQNFLLPFSKIANLKGGFNTDNFFMNNAAVSPGGTIDGGAGVNFLFGGFSGTTNTWIVNGINSGIFIVPQTTFNFSNIQNLNGSNAVDVFKLRGGVLYGSGSIDGGDGEDTIEQEDNVATTWTLTGDGAGTISDATPETFTVNGETVTTNVLLKDGFRNVENLIGGAETDTFNVNNGVTFTGDVDGGGGSDRFNSIGTGRITGSINGGSDGSSSTDVLDLSAVTGAVTIDLNNSAFSGVERIIGNGANTTIIGTNTANTWTVNGANGTVNGVTFANVGNLRGGSDVDTFNIQATTNPITIDAGAGDDRINLGSLAPNLGGTVNNITGALTISGGEGNDQLTIDDSGDTAANTGNLTATTITGLGTNGISYGTVETLNINLGSGADTFNVQATSASTTVNAGAGNDVITVGSATPATVNAIAGALTINGGADSDTVTINDSGDTTANTGTLTATTLTGLGTNGISYGTVENLNINLGSGADTFTIQATNASTTTTVNTGAGNDVITVGSATPATVNAITGALTINGGADTDTVTINDSGDTANNRGTLTATAITGLSFGSITYGTVETLDINLGSGADTFTIQATSASTVTTVNAGGGADTLNVESVSSATTVNADTGNDVITVGSATPATVNAIAGALTINGGADTDTVTINDSGDTTANTGTLTATAITGLSPGSITYGTVENLNINLGAGADTFTIQFTSVSTVTTVNAGGGADTLNVQSVRSATTVNADTGNDVINVGSAGTVNEIIGALTINGGADADTVTINDSGDTRANTGTLTAIAITGLSPTLIAYGTVENLNINLGAGADTFTIQFTSASTVTTVNAGGGADTLNVESVRSATTVNADTGNDVITVGSATPATVNAIAGALTINGGADTDTVTINDSGDTANNTGTLTATTITGLSPGTITYGTAETLNINLGAGADTFTIQAT
ncbi:MAG: hypothetical protein KME21_32120, partial [Desmonostoc vinosum HA7617-LM4]|nr:hypothetical protein [Desmonostoc vinosum HA7617-LM4]